MSRVDLRIRAFVALIVLLAAGGLLAGWSVGVPFPGLWPLVSFALVAFLLDQTKNELRVEASGSTSFVVHLAAGALFGPFWGGLVAGGSTALTQIVEQRPPVKAVFNSAQRLVCVAGGLLLVHSFGGSIPLFDFFSATISAGAQLKAQLSFYLLYAGFYFAFNTSAVTIAVALNSGRRIREVWNLNARGVLGYDVGASLLAVALAWLYAWSEKNFGFGIIGFVIILAPILVIRHIYGLYRRLQNSGRELLDLMVKAIEARDPYTSGHSIRVATLAKAIAQDAKMSAEEVEQVYTAAILHDVGKIHEEFAPLLRKDSKLTPEETALLQTHAVKSAELVGIISSFRGAILDAVRNHHERWDGGGYPDGLAGEDIPLGARIIMISDTTDAMTTDRPYRKRLPIEAVISELQKYRGTQFDPRLVDMVVNSVTVRRVMAELQAGNNSQQVPVDSASGGSKRVLPGGSTRVRGRSSWPRIRAF
jgi:putative nucleotidyltransferase with HDIG domain